MCYSPDFGLGINPERPEGSHCGFDFKHKLYSYNVTRLNLSAASLMGIFINSTISVIPIILVLGIPSVSPQNVFLSSILKLVTILALYPKLAYTFYYFIALTFQHSYHSTGNCSHLIQSVHKLVWSEENCRYPC